MPILEFIDARSRTFDVTITVDNGLLTLTMINDPLGTPTTHTYSSPITTTGVCRRQGRYASVGASGTVTGTFGQPRFRAQDLALLSYPARQQSGQHRPQQIVPSFVTTKSESAPISALTGGFAPMWSQALDAKGDRGTMS